MYDKAKTGQLSEANRKSLSRREFLLRSGKGSAAALAVSMAPELPPRVHAKKPQPSKSLNASNELVYASATTLAKVIREKQVS